LLLPCTDDKKVRSGCPAKNGISFTPNGDLASKGAP
jgi:hypothetical protein